MKKDIKIILLSGILIALFLSTIAFPPTTQAEDGVNCPDGFEDTTPLSSDQRDLIIKAFKEIYRLDRWQKCICPFISTVYPNKGDEIYKCEKSWLGDKKIEHSKESEDERQIYIEEHLDSLTTCGQFNTEWTCINDQNKNLIGITSGDKKRVEKLKDLIKAIGAELHSPSPSTEDDINNLIEQIELDVPTEPNEDTSGSIFGTIIGGLTKALIWSMQPSSYGGYTVSNEGVSIIWDQMRKFVNIGLIIAMILMAVATIIGIEKYSWKKVLWKIVVVALLVNFSLVIVGMIVDIFNYFTVYFLNSAKVNAANFGGLFNFPGPTFGFWNILGNFIKWFFTNLLMIFVGVLVIIILLVALLAMIARAVIIMFLAAISPLAFVAWIFPATEKWWKMWWDNFLKWASFGLIFAISLYIGMAIIGAIQSQNISISDTPFTTAVVTTLMAAIFLLVGLIFSLQSGTAASQFILKQSGKIGGAITKWGGRKTKERITESAFYKRTGLKLAKSRIPFIRGGGQRMVIGGEKAKKERIKKHEKDYENLSLSALLDATKGGIPSPVLDREGFEERIAITNILARMGKLNKESIDFIGKYKDDDRFDQKAITEAVPQSFHFEDGEFTETGETVDDKVKSLASMKASKIENIQGAGFIEDTVAQAKANALKSGKTEAEANTIAENTFKELMQKLALLLRPDQMAALYKSISPKNMQKNNWGGKEGKIFKAISDNTEASNQFLTSLSLSRSLRERSGFQGAEKEKQTKQAETKEKEREVINL